MAIDLNSLTPLGFKKSYVEGTDKNKMLSLDAYVREHLKKVLKTNGTTDEEVNLSIKNIQDMLSKVS